MTFWTAPRPWKGKACNVILVNGARAHLTLTRVDQDPDPFGFPDYAVFDPAADSELLSLNARCANVHTDARYGDGHTLVRLMGEGVMSGLEERRDHLPGRFVVAKAIGLAVHLGASTIHLSGVQHITPRAQRNLDTMARPLKGHRVRLLINGAPE